MPSIDNGFQTITITLKMAKENVIDHLKEWSLISIKNEQMETNQEHVNSGVDFVLQEEHSQDKLTTESVDVKHIYELRK